MSARRAVTPAEAQVAVAVCNNCGEFGTGAWTRERDRFVCDQCLQRARPGVVLVHTRGIFTAMSALIGVAGTLVAW